MPKIVDKLEKRKKIAKSTCSLFIQKGFVNISISEIAKTAGVGKGTIYEYFSNKEDIVFELMSCLQDDYDPKLQEKLKNNDSTKQKICHLFSLFLDNDETTLTQKQIYKEFLAIYLNNPTQEIKEYYKSLRVKYGEVLIGIFKKAIERKELNNSILKLVPSIFAAIEGFFVIEASKSEIEEYFDSILLICSCKGEGS
jgi:AcrR family transcriptional regulator